MRVSAGTRESRNLMRKQHQNLLKAVSLPWCSQGMQAAERQSTVHTRLQGCGMRDTSALSKGCTSALCKCRTVPCVMILDGRRLTQMVGWGGRRNGGWGFAVEMPPEAGALSGYHCRTYSRSMDEVLRRRFPGIPSTSDEGRAN